MQEELKQLLADMDVPPSRLELRPEDVRWLSRNLGIRNSAHLNFTRANQLVRDILRKEARK